MQTEGTTRVVVITGCDSGIGAALAALCLERGYTVASGHLGALPEPSCGRHLPIALEAAIPDRLLDSLIFRAYSLGRLASHP